MRILFVDHTAGVTPFQGKFAAVAARPDVELTVLGPDRWVENYREIRARSEDRSGYRLRVAPVVWPGYENRGFFVSGLARVVREARPDLIHMWEEPFSLMALQCVAARGRAAPGAPIVFASSDDLSFGFRYPYRPSWAYSWIERRVHGQVAGGTAINPRVVEVLRSKGFAGPLEIVPHGVDLGPYESIAASRRRAGGGSGGDGMVVGYVGRLLRQKGVDLLLLAFASLDAAAARGTRLLIVGGGPEEGALRALAAELGLGERVTFRAAVTHEDVPAVLGEVDVLVLPSRRVPGWQEQFGRILIEGMAAGCCVVGAKSGAIPDVVGDAGLLFEEESEAGLRSALERVVKDRAILDGLARRGQERVRERYTWGAVADMLVPFYRRILDEAAPRGR